MNKCIHIKIVTSKSEFISRQLVYFNTKFILMAENKRRFKMLGQHESAMSDGSESDYLGQYAACPKNPGHLNLISAKDFSLKHLPVQHRDYDVYNFMKSVASLTVRIDVGKTSPQRPLFWPNTNNEYPFNRTLDEMRPVKLRHGTGRVSLVTRYKDGYDDDGYKHLTSHHVCRCRKCQSSNSPSNVWWDVEILTAAHVVFDTFEASHTSCRLFYDEEDSPVVAIDGVTVDFLNVERDWCRLTCVTCDRDLGERLYSMKKECNTLWKNVQSKYYNSEKEEHKFMFIVSHPHGCPKRFSIGKWCEKFHSPDDSSSCFQFSYETSTCAGSSGATVYCLGYTGWWLFQLVHSGTDSGLNYTGLGYIL